MITNIIIAHLELVCFQNILKDVFANLNRWFKDKKQALNFDKANYKKFLTKNKPCRHLNSDFGNKKWKQINSLSYKLTAT
jgi:hypothetical protein